MKIILNGEPVELAPGTVADLAVGPSSAVAVNGSVVARSRHAGHALAEGDVVEIVTAVQGG